ncbi:Zn(II)2Cys6 transcription factor domain-containing protein, partial [Aspergillus homomorphus CBS 101889]
QRAPWGSRSRTGCRTCRARRVKCDENPGQCRNCTTTGRSCEGYDPAPLPRSTTSQRRQAIAFHLPPIVTTKNPYLTTADERRCFEFFQSRTIPDILGAFDSPLWHQLVLQMARLDPAVCHAAMALAAAHQESQATGMGLRPAKQQSPWNLFASDQAARSFALLRRRNPRDPMVPQVVLLCCVLFVMLDLVWRRFDQAFTHLQSGLRILNELHRQGKPVFRDRQGSPVDWHIVTALRHLDIHSTQFGCEAPLLEIREEARLESTAAQWQTIRSVAEGRRALDPLATLALEFIKRGWSPAKDHNAARYASIHREQLALLALMEQAQRSLREFHTRQYASLTPRDQIGAEILNVNLHWISLGLRTTVVTPGPAYVAALAADSQQILTTSEAIIAKLPPERPTIMFDTGIISPLFIVALVSPDFHDRWRAIMALHAWPHCEGPYSSAFHAHLAEKMLEGELRAR